MDQATAIYMNHRRVQAGISSGLWLALGCLALAPLLPALLLAPQILPALSAVLFVAAAAVALCAWLSKTTSGSDPNSLTAWDAAAILAFAACVAGSLSETASVAQFFGVSLTS